MCALTKIDITLLLRRILQIRFITFMSNFQLFKILFEKGMPKLGSTLSNSLADAIYRINTFH